MIKMRRVSCIINGDEVIYSDTSVGDYARVGNHSIAPVHSRVGKSLLVKWLMVPKSRNSFKSDASMYYDSELHSIEEARAVIYEKMRGALEDRIMVLRTEMIELDRVKEQLI